MLSSYLNHNLFKENFDLYLQNDPQLFALSQLTYQYSSNWWEELPLDTPGLYILTGGRQVGKSTSCKQLIKYCLENKFISAENILYLPCDEIFDAKELSQLLRFFLASTHQQPFLLIIDEITYVPHWDRVIKSLADEGFFTRGLCVLTGSDSAILKEAAMSFPGRRGIADQSDFHLYPLSFLEYVQLRSAQSTTLNNKNLFDYFQDYLHCGGYLRAINDWAQYGKILPATFLTYEQWIRGDFLKRGKKENYLLSILRSLLLLGVSPISYSALTQKIGLLSKETCIDYLKLLERMDILIELQAFDQNTLQGFPKKDRKFHFFDPFIYQTIYQWLCREGQLNSLEFESTLVEACVASHCYREGKVFYFKGQGEIDIIWKTGKSFQPIEIKWSSQLRPNDFKMLRQFNNSLILGKNDQTGTLDSVQIMPVYQFLYQHSEQG